MKTSQAIRTVLNNATETLNVLISGGLIDYSEGAKLEKIIQLKIRQLITFPATIQPLTAEELLSNVPWLENAKNQINFIKSKAKILVFDYGDIICTEGDMPRGIHLLVSGLVKLYGSNPVFGHNKDFYDQEEAKLGGGKIPFTDYRGSGAILGELNCLTKHPMEVTISCETLVQTCFISINDLFEAFDAFLEFPSLEYKIWLTIAIHIAVNTFKESIRYQNWTHNDIYSWLANAYVEDIEINKKFVIYDGTMDDIVLVYGSVEDCILKQVYYAPCIIPQTSYQIQATTNIAKILIVPSVLNKTMKTTANWRLVEKVNAPCLQHAAARRKGGKCHRKMRLVINNMSMQQTSESTRLERFTDGGKDKPSNLLKADLP
ncbi:sodium/hydrogen exchanger 10-like [Rhinatrema bivittatum]|uniref:sodium/hydrogen exchanger 10-like n=1 Tax=Rhinatrema bivittatum TaxID=194408 RepID=UPI00112706D5|nr:sodium/hydrogen exchanger 10-like [Rhinatrema bivittatum]XP_029438965.1 sodium/hydrogen exchanger 10-like [Rhinatrema bivittatum]